MISARRGLSGLLAARPPGCGGKSRAICLPEFAFPRVIGPRSEAVPPAGCGRGDPGARRRAVGRSGTDRTLWRLNAGLFAPGKGGESSWRAGLPVWVFVGYGEACHSCQSVRSAMARSAATCLAYAAFPSSESDSHVRGRRPTRPFSTWT